jgi:uncharacterized RDD family membrane protein YckC
LTVAKSRFPEQCGRSGRGRGKGIMSSGPFAPPPPLPPGAPVVQTPAVIEPPSFAGYAGAAEGLTGVGFGIRFLARLVDTLVHYCIGIAAGLFVGILLGLYSAFAHQPISHLVHRARAGGPFVFLFALLGSVAYHAVCESVHGSSAGKMLLSLVAVNEDGKPCGFKAALIRSLAYFIDALFFGLIGYMAMQKSPQQQRHGDSWAGTVVCKRDQVQPQNLRPAGRFILGLFCGFIADAGLFVVGLVLNMLS